MCLRRHGPLLALTATVVLAAVARFLRLDLMEFKSDEAEACRLALHALGHSEPESARSFPHHRARLGTHARSGPRSSCRICTVLLLLALHGLVVQKRPSSAFWLLLLLGAATKLHFSAWLLAVVLVIARVRHGTPCDGAG
jgi:hypothetical protein